MNKTNLILVSLFLNAFFIKVIAKECGEEQIENCKECGKGEESNNCEICEAGYFRFLNNLLCIPCNDPIYGQPGCKGECIRNNNTYSNSINVFCQDCINGYYNEEGICRKNDYNYPGCLEFSKVDNEFKCQKCLNEKEYKLDDDSFTCIHCITSHSNCKKCHFLEGAGFQSGCDECEDGFYLDSNKECKQCQNNYMTGGYCHYCTSDLKPDYCKCDTYYALSPNNACINCPENCYKCEFNKETNSTKCLRCNPGYIVDEDNQCIRCGDGCSYCFMGENKKQKCLVC